MCGAFEVSALERPCKVAPSLHFNIVIFQIVLSNNVSLKTWKLHVIISTTKSPIDFPAFGSYRRGSTPLKIQVKRHFTQETRVNKKKTRERVNCFFLRIDKWMIVQCEVISVTGRNWQSTTLPQNSTTSTEKWAVTKWFSSFRKLLKHGEEEESCGCVKDATRFNKRWVVKSTLPFIFHFLTYVNVYITHNIYPIACVCVCLIFLYIRRPVLFPFLLRVPSVGVTIK